ncbi:MAG: hypothetical protein K9M44_03700 [Candidatus Pacebacteria bacterium]|nr:hypothetical protein [Candidatus Paceibacterota bacterium]
MVNIERARSAYENTGRNLETEVFGDIAKNRYNLLALQFLSQKSEDKKNNNDGNKVNQEQADREKYEKYLALKKKAMRAFNSVQECKDAYINYEDSMRIVEESQEFNPEKPNKIFPKLLLENIHAVLDNDSRIKLKFFSATGGTHLDYLHGVDFFVKMYDKESGEELSEATIDATMRDRKKVKADLVIKLNKENQEKIDASSNNEKFDKQFLYDTVSQAGYDIAKILRENYKA